MNYLIQTHTDGRATLGTQNQKIVRDVKSETKLRNALKSFNPYGEFDEIKIFSYNEADRYKDEAYKLVRTIPKKAFDYIYKY